MNARQIDVAALGRGFRAAVCVGLVGCVLVVLAGCGKTAPGGSATSKAPAPPAAGAVSDRVVVSVDGTGFHPDRIPAHAGKPITLVLTRTTNETCATEIVFKSLDVRRELPLDKPVEVTITPSEKGELAFACPMDMFKGAIVAD